MERERSKGANLEEFHKVLDWLFAILRFAVTQGADDRAVALSIAYDMDRHGRYLSNTQFSYFVRTSTEMCDAIVAKDSPEKLDCLRRHITNIDHQRLRRAFEAILEIDAGTRPSRARRRTREHLFRGLPMR